MRPYQFSICTYMFCPFLELHIMYILFKLPLSYAWTFILNICSYMYIYNYLYENMCSRREFTNSIETGIYAFVHEHMKLFNIICNRRVYTPYKYDIWSNVYSFRHKICFFYPFPSNSQVRMRLEGNFCKSLFCWTGLIEFKLKLKN